MFAMTFPPGSTAALSRVATSRRPASSAVELRDRLAMAVVVGRAAAEVDSIEGLDDGAAVLHATETRLTPIAASVNAPARLFMKASRSLISIPR
jgi:hypothetical protein